MARIARSEPLFNGKGSMRSLTTVCATRSATVGTPSFRVPPDALGISTCLTGGG